MNTRLRLSWLRAASIGAFGVGTFATSAAFAEGSGQLQRLAPNTTGRGLLKETQLYVDVLNGDTAIQISARGTDNTLKVNVTAPGASSATAHNMDSLAHGQLDNATLPTRLPDATHTPISIPVNGAGTYLLQFSQDVEPFDVTVTQTTPSLSQQFATDAAPTGGGRLYSKDWRFWTPVPSNTTGDDPKFYVRSAVDSSHEYLWKLDFAGLFGGYMCLTANDLGLPAPFSRSSRRYADVQAALNNNNALDRYTLCPQLSKFPIYVNPPNSIKPAPQAPVLQFGGIGACGAVLEGAGGQFVFTSNLPATYELVIDTDKDNQFAVPVASGGSFVINDVVIAGTAQPGSNTITWDGKGKTGQVLPASGSPYKARLYLRVGEFHFTGSDIEGVSGGIAVYQVNAQNLAESGARIFWDDTRLDNATGTPATPIVPLPDGVQAPAQRHSWTGVSTGGQEYNGPGENALVDTWVFGDQTSADVTFTIYTTGGDQDNDGLSNGRECQVGSRFDNVDSDGDGLRDDFELSANGSVQDTDGDGTPDVLDTDDDNDTLLTKDELADKNHDGDPSDAIDTNADAIPNYLDPDDDGDGILTSKELQDAANAGEDDADGDGIPNWLDPDSDNDGLKDGAEAAGNGDSNNNGVPDYLEPAPPTNSDDSDDDGVRDEIECPNPSQCPNTDGDKFTDDQDDDDDGDGVLTSDELGRNGARIDTDRDGIPDYLDDDDDNDGLLTADELGSGKLPADTDDDGLPDYLDDDDDDDGNPTAGEIADAGDLKLANGNPSDVDGDGKENWLDTDSDGDGIPDATENMNGGDSNDNGVPDYLEPGAAPIDSDHDGVPDSVECPNGKCPDTDGDGKTDQLDRDDDGDGILTSQELADARGLKSNVSDVNDVDGDGKKNWLDTDSDGDGALDAIEDAGLGDQNANGILDYLEPGYAAKPVTTGLDTDGDGLLDSVECPTSGACPDTDFDGITDEKDSDDDGDGVRTHDELSNGAPRDTDKDGIPDHLDADDDGDTLLTKGELGTGGSLRDSDGDGIYDFLDNDDDGDRVNTYKEVDMGKLRDSDRDGKPDYLDIDDDGDGLLTTDELGDPASPRDSDGDGLPDYLDPDQPRGPSVEGGGARCAVQPNLGAQPGSGALKFTPLFLLSFGMLWARRRKRALAGLARAAAIGVTAGAVLAAPKAEAQTLAKGFALDRFDAAERGSDWFWGDSLDFRGTGRVAAGITGDWARKPLLTYDGRGKEYSAIIKDQLFLHLGASVNLGDRVRIGAALPLLLLQDGSPVVLGASRFEAKEGFALGDLRFGVDVRVVGRYSDPVSVALGAQVFLPTGSRESYTGDGKVRFAPHVLIAGDISAFTYSARLGAAIHALRDDFAGHAFGTDIQYGATFGFRAVDRALLIGPEFYGSTVVSDAGDGLFKRQTSPFEAVLGAHYFAGPLRFGLGAGPGFTSGLGSPAFRALATLEWFTPVEEVPLPPPPPPDRDGDGIIDVDDACPLVAGVPNADKTKHGCPPVERKDTDGDGIFDDEDACLYEPGLPSEDKKKHGCPLPDTDRDGVLDQDDACVHEPGEKNADPAKNGCPAPKDSDDDGILDPEDACPRFAGPRDADPAKNGCPRVQVTEERVIILDRIEFDTNRATIRPESSPILDAVYSVLNDNPQLTRIRIEGHTDNRGAVAHNRDLSRKRADAVVKWLIARGIDAKRLTSAGFGPDKPIDSNDTDTGRQNNRRVEFHIESKNGE